MRKEQQSTLICLLVALALVFSALIFAMYLNCTNRLYSQYELKQQHGQKIWKEK